MSFSFLLSIISSNCRRPQPHSQPNPINKYTPLSFIQHSAPPPPPLTNPLAAAPPPCKTSTPPLYSSQTNTYTQMGCCASTAKPPKTPHIANSKTAAKRCSISKSPPPTHPLHEEETVKEVLSETPAIPSKPFIPRFQGNRPITESPFIKSSPLLPADYYRTPHKNEQYQNGGACKKPFTAHGVDDLSEEVSEICSTLGESESVSVSTTLTEKRENIYNDESRELRQRSPARLKNRSFSGEVKREKTAGRSPGRRSEQPSPNRVRPAPGSASMRKRESGESSGRRSRSPVTRTESGTSRAGLGRTQSGRKTGKSPGRVGSGLGERTRKVDEGGDCKWPPTSNESLENPLVSLECFIFL